MNIVKFNIVILIISALLISSCTKKTDDALLTEASNKLDEARSLEERNQHEEAKKTYENVTEIYKELLKLHPSSRHAPEVLSNLARIYSENLKDYQNAVKYYEELVEKFPGSKQAKYGLFMIAFIYDEFIQDKDKAIQYYQRFLDKYPVDEDPNEKMSESARMMLQMLKENRSIEDIIKGYTTPSEKKDTLP